MKTFTSKTLATLATVISVQAVPDVTQANGGHLHFGTVDIPYGVFYGVGGFVAVVVLFFFANWARYRRSQSRGDQSPEPERSHWDDEEEEDVK
jgi:hypothetical protein